MSHRKPYSGTRRTLVIGIDVGTTFSGASYSILDPGAVPVILGVNRYPAQERVGGNAKIPSIMFYDSAGVVRAAGAEVLLESNIELARDQQWTKAEWFKLYLRPNHTKSCTGEDLPPLPPNKTPEHVFGDFLQYIFKCIRTFIEETHAGGVELWGSLRDRAEFVLTHPNGWEGAQQAQMRVAAIHAGLISATPSGHSRIHFVTEGEASLHYCIGNNYASDTIKSGEGVIIVDAGGGTIDLSAFYLKEKPSTFEEIAPASCHFQGSVYVTRRAKAFLRNKLINSRYNSAEDVDYIAECFDRSTKLAFRDPSQFSYVKFGSTRDTDPSVNIKFGQLKLPGSDVAAFFEPSIAAIQKAIEVQKNASHISVTSVLLVGGFAASNWLFSNLNDRLRHKKLRLFRPDGHLGKAVADGAVSFLVDHFVSMRVARTTFGMETLVTFDPDDPEHLRRMDTIITNAAGETRVPEAFDVILAKGTRVSESTIITESYQRTISSKSELTTVEADIFAYRGDNPKPAWMDDEPGMYSKVGTVTADVKSAVERLPPLSGPVGKPYFRFHYELELLFGLTEHKAQICWVENGKEQRSPATIIYDHGV